jgi:uncharacterized glyoxalase superfamily protein PhnB
MDGNSGTGVGLWLAFKVRDADTMIRWLSAIGFTAHAIHRTEADPTVVAQAEMLWPDGGGVMFGSYQESAEDPQWPNRPGTAAAYLVTDDPDRVHAAALAAGGTSLYAPRDEDFGGRTAGAADPEGNLWSFGSYRPAA